MFSADHLLRNRHRFHPRFRHHALQSAVCFWLGMVVLAAKSFSARDNSTHAHGIIFRVQFVVRCAVVEQNCFVAFVDCSLRRNLDGEAKSFRMDVQSAPESRLRESQ